MPTLPPYLLFYQIESPTCCFLPSTFTIITSVHSLFQDNEAEVTNTNCHYLCSNFFRCVFRHLLQSLRLFERLPFLLDYNFLLFPFHPSRLIPVWTLAPWTNYRVTLCSRTWNPDMPTSFTFVSFKGYSTHVIPTTLVMYLKFGLYLIGKFK